MWYNVDFIKLVTSLLPTFLRKPLIKGLIKALTAPIASIYYDWVLMREDHLYKLQHNGQVCYLRKSLNDKFDPDYRRIYIGEGYSFDREYIFTRSESQPVHLGAMILHPSTSYAGTNVDFIVYVPDAIKTAQVYALHAHIEYYREGVKRYNLESI